MRDKEEKQVREFAVGDSVVIVNHNVHDRRSDDRKIGTIFEISKAERCRDLDSPARYTQVLFPAIGNGFFNSEIELSYIHNSPLMKALR